MTHSDHGTEFLDCSTHDFNDEPAVLIVDDTGRIASVKRSQPELWGYSTRGLCGQHLSAFLLLADVPSMQRHIREVLSSKSSANFDCRVIQANGNDVSVSWTLCWSQIDNAVVLCGRTAIDRQSIDKESHQKVAAISHDLRSPLTSIGFSVELLLEFLHSPQAKEALLGVKENTASLLKLVNEILELEKSGANDEQFQMLITRLNADSGVSI